MMNRINRRNFLRSAAVGAAGLSLSTGVANAAKSADTRKRFHTPRIRLQTDEPSHVGLIQGNNRKQNLLEALDLIKDDIKAGIGDKQVIIKVNFTSSLPDAGTHVDVVSAICETITPFYKKKIVVTEGQGNDNPIETDWLNFGYYDLQDAFNVELRDEWVEPFSPLPIIDHNWQPHMVDVCETWRDPDTYMISAAVLKHHRTAVVTLSLKNVLMASIWNHNRHNQRKLMHVSHVGPNRDQSINRWEDPVFAQQFQLNQFLIGQHTAPDLAVIDGFQGMEEWELKGPVVDHRVALCGTDFLATDRVGAALMDVDINHVGALNHCYNAGMGNLDLAKITVLGNSIAECKKHYNEDPRTKLQRLHWKTG